MKPKLEIAKDWNLEKLILELEAGHIKIPGFQRDYIWEKNKVVKLLNSIYNQYPIGSFFFWIAPAQFAQLIRDNNQIGLKTDNLNNQFEFILDGQQRILSLYLSLRGKTLGNVNYSTICFNPVKKEFRIPRSKNDKYDIAAWKLFDSENFSQTFNQLLNEDKKFTKRVNYLSDIWDNCRQIFINYPVSIVKTSTTDIDDVVEIFERINQGGKNLTIFDLVQATTWSTTFDLKEHINDFNTPEFIKKHGLLANKVFVISLTLNAFDDARNINQLKLSPALCKTLWPKTRSAINASVNFLKQMRITGNLLAYHNMLPIIQYYFFKTNQYEVNPEHQKDIEKWFWDAKFTKRYSTSGYARIKEDQTWVLKLINGA